MGQWVSDEKKGDKGDVLCLPLAASCHHSKATQLKALCPGRCAPLADNIALECGTALPLHSCQHMAHGALHATNMHQVESTMWTYSKVHRPKPWQAPRL